MSAADLALQERTQAELEWLELKKQQLRSKGSDELTPSLLKREKGLRKTLQQEQAEIRRLQEVQRTASHERRLMLQQQQEISKMKKSAKYYREKIRCHRLRGVSPTSTHTSDREFSPSPSLEDSGQVSGQRSLKCIFIDDHSGLMYIAVSLRLQLLLDKHHGTVYACKPSSSNAEQSLPPVSATL